MTETAPEVPAETVTPEPAPQSEAAAPAAPQEPEAAPADHESLLRELAGFIRGIPLDALQVAHVTDLVAWLSSHGL